MQGKNAAQDCRGGKSEKKMREKIAGVENAGKENAGIDCRGGKCGKGKCGKNLTLTLQSASQYLLFSRNE